eukprot:g4133.t1
MVYPDGHKVTGKWELVYSWQVFTGHGTVEWTDGRIWKGPWKNGQPHGHGVLTYADGDVVHGNFEHGHCKECEDEHRAHYEHIKKKKYHHIHMNMHGESL